MTDEIRSRRFLIAAGVCALLSGLTTLGVHLMPALWSSADTFAEQVELRSNPVYLSRLWIVMIHCGLVLVSMAGAGTIARRTSPLLAVFGFASFVTFALMEWIRTSLTIFGLNRTLRRAFVEATSDEKRDLIRQQIELYPGMTGALFFLFFVAFTVGLFCYGIALAGDSGRHRLAGFLFLAWGLLNLPTFVDQVTGTTALAGSLSWVGPVFQPVARIAIGIWLLAAARSGPALDSASQRER